VSLVRVLAGTVLTSASDVPEPVPDDAVAVSSQPIRNKWL